MSIIITHRLLAIAAHWSLDRWSSLPEADRRRQVPRGTASSYSILLSKEFPGTPAPRRVAEALADTDGVAEGYEGHAVVRCHALLDGDGWRAFIRGEGEDVRERMARSIGERSPPIAYFWKLAHARRAIGLVGTMPSPARIVPPGMRDEARLAREVAATASSA